MVGPRLQDELAPAKTIDIDAYLSERSKLWRASNIRGLFPLEHTPGIISLLAGKPNPTTFPFEAITLSVRSPLPDEPHQDIRIDGAQLDQALQYGMTGGLPGFVKWLEEFQSYAHGNNRDAEGWKVVIGSGSQDMLSKAFQVFLNEGDAVLVEAPAYPFAEGIFNIIPSQDDVDLLRSKNIPTPDATEIITVKTDGKGLDPQYLQDILTNWSSTHPGKPKPKVLYTVPVGSNPTGATIPESRKTEVLRIAKEHNLIIFEDDAYAYLYYGEDPKPRSYFSLEREVNGEVGRVIRFDSFSKILSSGMRIGFMTAHEKVCKVVDLNTSNANLQCSSTTQMMALALLSSWGFDGLLSHCRKVSDFYKTKRDMFERAARTHLQGVATWTTPVAGMFLFIELLPLPDGTPLDSFSLIRDKAVQGGVLAVPGAAFLKNGTKSSFVRVSFSLANEETANEAFKRLRKVIDAARA